MSTKCGWGLQKEEKTEKWYSNSDQKKLWLDQGSGGGCIKKFSITGYFSDIRQKKNIDVIDKTKSTDK